MPIDPRPATDADADALVALIGGVYAEYPGCVLDLEGIDDDLVAPATAFERHGGHLWLVDEPSGRELLACVGAGPLRDGSVELKRLYVHRDARGRGLGTQLVRWVEAHAVGLGAERIELWSDTRFLDAHRHYRRLGYAETDELRDLDDPSHTTERRFERQLARS